MAHEDDKPYELKQDHKGLLFVNVIDDGKPEEPKKVPEPTVVEKVMDIIDDGKLNNSYKKKRKK